MPDEQHLTDTLSPWWRNAVILILILGFSVLIWVAVRSYKDAPPIPGNVAGTAGTTLFTRADILAGQQVFLKHGLMENGPIGALQKTLSLSAWRHTRQKEVRLWNLRSLIR